MVFSRGVVVLGIQQVRLGEHRSERFIGVALLLGRAFAAIQIWRGILNKLLRRTQPGAFKSTRSLPPSTYQRTSHKQECARISASSYAL
jgi:hypothetical protein